MTTARVRVGGGGRLLPVVAAAVAALVVASPLAGQAVAKASFLDRGSFSLPSQGSGALDRPVAIAWAPSDQVHVADERGTISVFRADGTPVRSYGQDTLRRVAGLDVDAAGRAYVLDPEQRSVLVFDEGGNVLFRIGSRGRNAGQLDDPVDVAVGPAGFVYVLDRNRKGVQVFSLDGTFVHDILLPLESRQPRALAVGPSGAVFVADRDWRDALIRLPDLLEALNLVDAPAPTIQRLPLRGADVRDVMAVVSTATGTVVVADQESGVLWSVDATGAAPVGPDDRFYGGKGSGRGSFRRLVDAAMAGADEMILLDRDERKVERVRLVLEEAREKLPRQDYPVQFQSVEPEVADGVLASAPTSRGTVWYALADAQGRNLRVVEAELRERSGVFGARIRLPVPAGGAPQAFGQEVERVGGAALNDSLLVVTEPRRNRFHAFDLRAARAIGSFGDGYADDRRLRSPRGVALFPDGRIAIADNGNGRVVVFSADLASLLGAFPLPRAQGVAVTQDGRLFAWDESGATAGEVPLDGGTFRQLPPSLPGSAVGALATDGVGNLYALRARTGLVAVGDAKLQRVVARVGGQTNVEAGDQLTVDVDGNIFVTDLERARSAVLRWGVDVDAVDGLTANWGDGFAVLRWRPLPGSFVTGYDVEGSASSGGPWSPVVSTKGPEVRVAGTGFGWLRVAARTLTGAAGRPSAPVPALHLAADRAFDAGDWAAARALAAEALASVESGAATADPAAARKLAWQGFLAAHEAGDHRDALVWNSRLGSGVGEGQRFEHAVRLADTNRRLGDLQAAIDEALRALDLAPSATPTEVAEHVPTLLAAVFEDGWRLRRWADVVRVGEEMLLDSGDDPDPAFVVRLAQAHLKAGTPDRALELAQGALDASTPAGRKMMSVLTVIASVQLGDLATAREQAAAVGDSVPEELFAEFSAAMTRVKLADGDVHAAQAELLAFLLEGPSDIRALADPDIATTAIGVYAELVATGDADGGQRMLERLLAAIPEDLATVRAELIHRADSAAAVADTRVKLGEGFRLFRDALFRDALRFFQAADARTDLDVDQKLIVKQVLAAIFHSLGRIEEADHAFRGVFTVDPDFVLMDHLAHVQAAYDLTIFTPEMLDHFRTVGPIM